MKTQKDKSLSLPVVWIGECFCGLLCFETSDGVRFAYAQRRRHQDWECVAMRKEAANSNRSSLRTPGTEAPPTL
jgi:hypothetical protein